MNRRDIESLETIRKWLLAHNAPKRNGKYSTGYQSGYRDGALSMEKAAKKLCKGPMNAIDVARTLVGR